jgi:hypothetical protein
VKSSGQIEAYLRKARTRQQFGFAPKSARRKSPYSMTIRVPVAPFKSRFRWKLAS